MDLPKSGDKVLFIWGGQVNDTLEQTVSKLKSIDGVSINVENLERIHLANYDKSTFNVILLNIIGTYENEITSELLGYLLKILKPNGKIGAKDTKGRDLASALVLAGYISVEKKDNSVFIASKPNYEVGSVAKLSFGTKTKKASDVWKLNGDDEEEETINSDDLLDEEDKALPDPGTLRVCGTTGKRKACKDCSCGLAEELAGEKQPSVNQIQKSSCGSCYLGDAFRCATCPYLGMPAFKPGEKVQISDNLLQADL